MWLQYKLLNSFRFTAAVKIHLNIMFTLSLGVGQHLLQPDTYSIKAMVLSPLSQRERKREGFVPNCFCDLMLIYQSGDILCILSPKCRKHLEPSCLKCYTRASEAGDWWHQTSTSPFHWIPYKRTRTDWLKTVQRIKVILLHGLIGP
jgi:hypothetical protein